MLTWDKADERYYHHGCDRGVLYPSKVPDPVLVSKNLFPNPDVADLSGYSAPPATTMTKLGNELVLTPAVNGDYNSYLIAGLGLYGGMSYGMQAGKTYTVSADVNTPTAQAATQAAARMIAAYVYSASLGYLIYYTTQGPTVGKSRISGTFTLPADTTSVNFIMFNGAQLGGGAVRFSKFLLEEGPVLNPYYSGASPDDLNDYSWAGVANASSSLKKKIVGRCIAWNGITGFDESGTGESPAIYYIDGKVYMADVDANDFSGKLSAYSWPDEFSSCLGIPEAADGLYVDNQKPKRFSMSYRTLIGSGLAGDRFGYQIHLVYKALASLNQRSRKTVNNSTDPMEFGFDLACTPVAMPGYRPSAHYIIDTRHLAPATVQQLENILYGTATTVGRMPDPQELFDLLSFGSAITFVKFTHPDLGECWTATGSFANVHMTGPDTFEILNVNGSVTSTAGLPAGQTYQLQDTP